MAHNPNKRKMKTKTKTKKKAAKILSVREPYAKTKKVELENQVPPDEAAFEEWKEALEAQDRLDKAIDYLFDKYIKPHIGFDFTHHAFNRITGRSNERLYRELEVFAQDEEDFILPELLVKFRCAVVANKLKEVAKVVSEWNEHDNAIFVMNDLANTLVRMSHGERLVDADNNIIRKLDASANSFPN